MVFLILIWLAVVAVTIAGPIDYPGQPSIRTLAVIATGILLFVIGHVAGAKLAQLSIDRFSHSSSTSPKLLNRVVAGAAIVGIFGISLVALDRDILSVSGYAAFLRCAPEFVDYINILRTPAIYVGYLTFSFGFVALALFLLRAEEIRWWAAYLAQLSIVVPVGYALTYSGRMPILLALICLVGVGLVRLYEGRPLLPPGRYLLLKMLMFIVVFAVYSNAMWSSRQGFCAQMEPVVRALRQDIIAKRNAAEMEKIDAGSLSRMIDVARDAHPRRDERLGEDIHSQFVIAVMKDAWGVHLRGYFLDIVNAQIIPPQGSVVLLSNYFYLTHGMMIIDRIWQGREHLKPIWGVYEIGVLSPIIRVSLPDSKILQTMNRQLRKAEIYGFFPTAWGAAFLDFGIVGGSLYVILWGLMGGWAFTACRRTNWVTPQLLLSFVLATVLLSPLQGPLGTANSALVLGSMIVVGLLIDLSGIRRKTRAGVGAPTIAEAANVKKATD